MFKRFRNKLPSASSLMAIFFGSSTPPPCPEEDPCKEEEPPEEEEFKLETAPFDPRFPQTNQTRYCWQSFVDYKRCLKLKGEDFEPCCYFKKVYTSMCPHAWVEKWEEQLEAGTFPENI